MNGPITMWRTDRSGWSIIYGLPLALFLVSQILAGCASLGMQSPETFNQRAAAATITVTGIRATATDLLRAKSITADDAQNVQDQADVARKGIDVARTVYKTDPAGADARLTATITVLQALQTYLRTRGAK